jgi:hypothetical protein
MAYPTTARVSMLANNQLIIKDGEKQIFQSYSSIICVKDGKNITLDADKWNFSATTTKYLGRFLGMNKAEIMKHIKDGSFKLADLN